MWSSKWYYLAGVYEDNDVAVKLTARSDSVGQTTAVYVNR